MSLQEQKLDETTLPAYLAGAVVELRVCADRQRERVREREREREREGREGN